MEEKTISFSDLLTPCLDKIKARLIEVEMIKLSIEIDDGFQEDLAKENE